jgi:superfamily II DNA or RNA helicase
MNEDAQIIVRKLNHATIHLTVDMDIAMELSSAFSFLVDGYKFAPSYKAGRWDGYIRLFNLGSRTLASGLYSSVVEFGQQRGYSVQVIDDSKETGYSPPGYKTELIDSKIISDYMDSLNLRGGGEKLVVRDYQVEGVLVALRERQAILHSSVGSGKSMILYCISRYLTEELGLRVLIIVPTVGLTTQMRGDFADYSSENGWNVDDHMHLISAGASHDTPKPIVISTFQSLSKTSGDWFNSFGAIISDEGHSITAKSFQDIYGKATEVPFRLACTGTLHDMKCNMLVMQGITGPVFHIATTKDLIAAGQLVPLKVKSISLDYPPEVCKLFSKVSYEDEIKWVTSNPKRNNFIKNLATKCVGTTLVFFRYIEHGKILYDSIKAVVGDEREVYLIDGGVSREDREAIRLAANTNNAIIVCSYGTMKAGVNLPAIENIIIGHPIKGGITFNQSLGRGLRLKKGKTHCNLFDIGDNLSTKRKVNHTYNHFGDRMLSMTREGYDFTLVNMKFG